MKIAPCLECGSDDITLDHSNYSSFNTGGGECNHCHRTTRIAVGCFPTMEELAKIWNDENDIPTLIETEEKVIQGAQNRIKELLLKQNEHD